MAVSSRHRVRRTARAWITGTAASASRPAVSSPSAKYMIGSIMTSRLHHERIRCGFRRHPRHGEAAAGGEEEINCGQFRSWQARRQGRAKDEAAAVSGFNTRNLHGKLVSKPPLDE